MLSFNSVHSIFLSSRPVDFRKQFDGLCGEVIDYLGRNPQDGSLFLFYNKRRDRMKLLWWESDGFWLFYKRLEQGTFEFPLNLSTDDKGYHLTSGQLQLILSGIELSSIKKRKRYNVAA
jgi:transposase